jgi:hypothetical protein
MLFSFRLPVIAAALALAAPGAHADVVISSAATQNMTCSAGVCAPTAADAVLNVGDLESLLASGNTEVTTTGSGVQAGNVALDAKLSWSAASMLELDAYQSIAVQQPVSVMGSGGLTIRTNDGGSGGAFSFAPKGRVAFNNLGSALTINGTSFTLVNSLPALASAVGANTGGAFALANNYDASQDGTYSQCPISEALDGAIEGMGNTISHLSLAVHGRFSEIAMIEAVDTTGSVENLRLTNIHVKAAGKYAASSGLVTDNDGYLFGDSVTGAILGNNKNPNAGGLVADNSTTGIISSSWTDVKVKTSGVFSQSGGLAGWNSGEIVLSHAAGNIEGELAGGLVANNEGTISQSYATASVEGGAGGLVGFNQDNGTIENTYATGNVGPLRGEEGSVGGLILEQDGLEVTTSYATGAMPAGENSAGFLCFFEAVNVSYDYWDTSTTGTTYGICLEKNYSKIVGLTTKQLKKELPPGFDTTIWALNPKINNGFPYLIANPPPK